MGLMLDAIYALGATLLAPVWGWRMWRTGKWRTDWRERFGHVRVETPAPDAKAPEAGEGQAQPPTLLVHAVSVGEVNAIRLLVDQVHEATAGRWRIIVSVTTDTGIARARQLFEPRHRVVRFPLDFSRSVSRFLDAIEPDLVALAELEVWPNFVRACEKRKIPVCVINGRLSARSFSRYRLIAPLLRPTFRRLAAVAVQTEDYARRFIHLGVSEQKLAVTDTMKWDTAQIADAVPGSDALARAMGIDPARPIVVAGSTAPGEHELLIDTLPEEAQLVLVPRRPEWFDEVARLTPGIVRRSAHGDDGPPRQHDGQRLFLLDTMGELRKAYALADICLVGRSFLGLYGSDMIEPVALGKPTIVGPHHSDFADIVAALVQGQGLIVTADPGLAVRQLLADPAQAALLARRGRDVILSRQGATRRHVALLQRLMPRRAGRDG